MLHRGTLSPEREQQSKTRQNPNKTVWFGGQSWEAVLLRGSLQIPRSPVTAPLTPIVFPLLLCHMRTLSVNTPFWWESPSLGPWNQVWRSFRVRNSVTWEARWGVKGRECRLCGTGPLLFLGFLYLHSPWKWTSYLPRQQKSKMNRAILCQRC